MKIIKIIFYIILISLNTTNIVVGEDFNSWVISFKDYALKKGISKETLDKYYTEYNDLLTSMHLSISRRLLTLVWEARYSLIINFLVGFGRALSEVGAIIIVGGNIAHLTRTMTTGIVLETSRGNLAMALSLGITLILIALIINILLYMIKISGDEKYV